MAISLRLLVKYAQVQSERRNRGSSIETNKNAREWAQALGFVRSARK